MDNGRWERAKRLLAEAHSLPLREREAFLDQACGDDLELRSRLQSLLDAKLERVGFLDEPPVVPREDDYPLTPGSQIGSYSIERELGRGGMSVVYLASRADEEFERQVALKVIRPRLMGSDGEVLLRRELQILSDLDHPNICQLLEAGRTDDGRLYLLMEYVQGEPIDVYCRRRLLGVGDRLRLFLEVCSAVHLAHQNRVAHGDLKPANILLTQDGVPKLLDFGVATHLSAPQSSEGAFDQRTSRSFTPSYASPEQLAGGVVTTASDIYSLGVVLHELLTGRRPTREGHLADQPAAAAADVLDPPSRAIEVSDRSSAKLRRRLAGDIDRIVLKARHEEPSERYSSANRLSEDIRRHLSHRPVEASGNRLSYLASRFVRRNRAGVAVAALVAILTLSFGVSTVSQHRETARQRDIAQQRLDRLEEVTSFLIDIFEIADPERGTGAQVTARELLDRAATRVDTELGDQPDSQSTLMRTIGVVYWKLGLYQSAKPLMAKSLELRRQLYGSDHLDVAESLYDLGSLLLDSGELEAAESPLRLSLEIRRRLLEAGRPRLLESLRNLANLEKEMGRYEEAERLYVEALEHARVALGGEHLLVASIKGSLADLAPQRGELEKAEALAREALHTQRSALGPTHPEVARTLDTLATILQEKGELQEAEAVFREALAINRQRLDSQHPTVATSLDNLSTVLWLKDDLRAAAPLQREALAIHRVALGGRHPDLATSIDNMGALLRDLGEYEEAEALSLEALEMRTVTLGDEHPYLAYSYSNLGFVYLLQGRDREARDEMERALSLRNRTYESRHANVASSHSLLGLTHLALGDLDAAEYNLRAARSIYEASLGPVNLQTITVVLRLAHLATERLDFSAAEELASTAIEALPADPRRGWRSGYASCIRAIALIGQGRLEEEEELFESSRRELQDPGRPEERLLSISLERIAAALDARGWSDRADQYRALARSRGQGR